jgi:hypothetical protein
MSDEEIKSAINKCLACGHVFLWEPTIWSYVPHEAEPLTCPNCGETDFDIFPIEEKT